MRTLSTPIKLTFVASAFIACALYGAPQKADEQGADDPKRISSIKARFWLQMNLGKDMTELAPFLQAALRPGSSDLSLAEALDEINALLTRIESEAPIPEVIASISQLKDPQTGSNWETMGGSPSHFSVPTDTGPQSGIVEWKYPVPWDWRAPPRLKGETVFIATPSIESSMIAFDRSSGETIWKANNPRTGYRRQPRASSPVFELSDNRLAVFRIVANRYWGGAVIVSEDDGTVLAQQPNRATEQSYQRPEPNPKDLISTRIDEGHSILVKSYHSNRTWWTFKTGLLPDEPLQTNDKVYAATLNGQLWAFNLYGDLRIAWAYRIDSEWGAAPTIHEGVLYLGANDGCLYAFDAEAGTLLWKARLAQPDPRSRQLFSKVEARGNRVYVGDSHGTLHAVNTTTGKALFSYESKEWIRSKPFATRDNVYFATLDGNVHALDVRHSEPTPSWSSNISRYPIYSNLTGDASGPIACSSNFDLVALDAGSGSETWRQSIIPCERDGDVKVFADGMLEIAHNPVTFANGKTLFTGKDGFVVAVDGKTGERLWRYELGGRISAAPTVYQGKVYVGQYWFDDRFSALDLETGLPLWERELGPVWASPEVDDDQVFAVTKKGGVFALEASTGETLWSNQVGKDLYPAPALSDDLMITGSWDGHFYAFERATGAIRWAQAEPGRTYQFGSTPDSPTPIIYKDRIFIPRLGGRSAAFELETGKILWEWQSRPYRICNVTSATNGEVVITSVFGNAYDSPFGMEMIGLDIDTGEALWSLPDIGGLTAPIITRDDRFFVASMGSPFIQAYQLQDDPRETPQLLWRVKTGGVTYESLPALSGDFAYFLSNDGWLRAIR